MVRAEHRYNPVENECLALVFAVQKTRHHLTGQIIYVVSRINSLRLLMTKPSALNGRLTKWAMLLSQYDMHFLPQKATKGQAIADLLAENPRSNSATLFEKLPDETAEYIPLKPASRSGKCISTEHLEPFHTWDWWPGLESYSFLSKTMSFHAHSPLLNFALTM